MMRINNIQQNMFEDISVQFGSKNLHEDEFVKFFKDLFGINSRNKFPNDFDAWTVKKQCSWINHNLAEFFSNVPQSLLNFIPAAFCQLDYDRSPEKLPKWIDMDKYRKGQKFVQKHYTAIVISKIMGLIYAYSFDEGSRPAILGERSHTPYLGFQKYVSTIKRILSWYIEDPWTKGTEAFKNMQIARRMHLAIRKKICQMNHEQIATACTFANPWCPDRELLLKDFAMTCLAEKFEQRPYIIGKKSPYKPKGMNNADFAAIQSCFVILPLFYPQNIGIYDATDEDLEAFCHIWKCYGYFLGMEDEYNCCSGSLEEIKQRVHDFFQYWIMQNFKELTPEWEHITRCLIMSMNYYPLMYMPYKVMILMTMSALNLNMSYLYASLNYKEWIVYKIFKFIFYTLKFSSMRTIINKIIYKIIDKATNFNAENLTDIHEKSKKILPDFSLMY